MLIAAAGAVYGVYGILSEREEVRVAETASAVFEQYSPFAAERPEPSDGNEDCERLFEDFSEKLSEMKKKNSDVIGWIYIPETHIDYPVVWCGNNDRYLTHAADGSASAAGAVFVDAVGMGNRNTVIYGHNMGRASSVMFHDITNFADKAWFDKVPYGYLVTGDEVLRLDIFAYALTYAETPFYSSEPDIDFIEQNAMYFRAPGNTERLFTLSTCAYDRRDARALLMAAGTAVWPK